MTALERPGGPGPSLSKLALYFLRLGALVGLVAYPLVGPAWVLG